MKKLALALSILGLMCGCSSNQPASASLIAVTIVPINPPNIDQGQTSQFVAGLTNDTSNKGVTWSVSGPGCSGTACGSLSNVTSTSATYHAPALVSANLAITITATSVAEPGQFNTAMFFVTPPPSIVTTDLPTATPNQNYSTTLVATGGVQPLNWSVASGSLPAGLSLNNAGVIFGTPTGGGTSKFTLKVTDSSGSALSTSQSFGLTVVGVLTVPAATLPVGILGTAYSASLPSSGGLAPLTWSIYSGNLPSGVVLQQGTGVISGTPTETGTFSFIVTVVDSSPIQQTFTSPTFSITINPSGPLTITSTAMPDGAAGAAYQGQLVATGGTAPLKWAVTSGALPSGLTLNPATAAITGIPTAAAGTYSFSVTVTDASVPQQTATQALNITVEGSTPTCSSTGNNSLLTGQYAFSLRGYNGVGFLAVVGSFTADGTGKITAGEADTNGVLGAQYGNLLIAASSYSVGPDNRGCATLATPFGTFFTRFAVGAVSAGVATAGRIIEFDNPDATAYIAAGQILQQSPTAFLTPLTGSYYLRTAGWDAATSGRVACVGVVIGASFKFSYLQQDCNDNGTVTSTITSATSTTNSTINTYGAADTNGRGTGVLSVSGNISDLTFYWVSTNQLFIINSDPSLTFSGEWMLQDVPTGKTGFDQTAFNGTIAAYASGLEPSGVGGDVSIASETANGTSSVTTQLYRDFGGVWQTPNSTCSYSVVQIGRITLVGSNCGATPPIPYLYSLNTGFTVGTDPTVELGSFEPQTTGLTNAAIAGTYFTGTSEVVSQGSQAEVGIVTLTSGGILTSTTDSSSVLNQSTAVAGSDTYTLKSDGTFSTGSSGSTIVGIAVSGSKFVLVANPTLTFPILQVGQR